MFLSGKSINAIAQAMNEAKAPTARAGKKDDKNKKRESCWYASTVRTILGNGLYAGVAQWDGVEVEDATPAIITRDIPMSRPTSGCRPSDQASNWNARLPAGYSTQSSTSKPGHPSAPVAIWPQRGKLLRA